MPPSAWVDDANAAALTDLYQLTMLAAYRERGLDGRAVFDLTARRLPPTRNFLLACGLDDALAYLEALRFPRSALAHLETLGLFRRDFLDYLADLRFTGDVRAVREGTPVFAGEPLVEVEAPLAEAQLVETFLLNQVGFGTLVASKFARSVAAAEGRAVVDFGLRRAQGADAGMKAARAAWLAGVAGTSNVLAGAAYGVPLSGTMAHSFVQAHDDEFEAFREFVATFPEATLLVDTYDTARGVANVVRLARELGPAFRVRAIRLDSGDLAALAKEARAALDAAGLRAVRIVASGNLDEDAIARLLAAGAPIDAFGVGTHAVTSRDAPSLDVAYKLVEFRGRGRMKLSTAKRTLPGAKQVYRLAGSAGTRGDVVALVDEPAPEAGATPLLETVMEGGKRTAAGRRTLAEARAHAAAAIAALPARVRGLAPADPPYTVRTSAALDALAARVAAELGG